MKKVSRAALVEEAKQPKEYSFAMLQKPPEEIMVLANLSFLTVSWLGLLMFLKIR